MLVKYYGLVFNEISKTWSPRTDFLSNGLFRMTQPKFLNDQGSESRLFPYFNEFAPADYAWARRKHDKIQSQPDYVPSNEELENFFLKPCGIRYGEAFPHLVQQQSDFKSMEEWDYAQLERTAETINSFLVEALSCQLGVLSLSKSDTNELMWTHYASEGKGIAVTFNHEHPFFQQYMPRDVSYEPEKRASLTYYKGMIRINGVPMKNIEISSNSSSMEIFGSFLKQGVDYMDFTERLLYSKAKKWSTEDETRIICPLQYCDEEKGKLVEPMSAFEHSMELPPIFRSYSEVYLKQIPFSAFESIVLGYNINDIDKAEIIKKVKDNPELSHLKIRTSRHNMFGEIDVVDIPL